MEGSSGSQDVGEKASRRRRNGRQPPTVQEKHTAARNRPKHKKKSLVRYSNANLSDVNVPLPKLDDYKSTYDAKPFSGLSRDSTLTDAFLDDELKSEYLYESEDQRPDVTSRKAKRQQKIDGQNNGGTPEVDDDWQTGKSLRECNQYMLTYEVNCDVTFIVGENREEVKGHRFILMSRNAKMFKILTPTKRDDEATIVVPEMTPETFRVFISYLYTDDVSLTVPLALALIQPCQKFGVKDLKTMCFQYLVSEMYSENVCKIFEQTHVFDEKEIHDKCLRFILVNAEDVLKAPNFKDLCRSCAKEILSSDELNADEIPVNDTVILWANAECSRQRLGPTDKNRREVLGDLLYTIRFPLMDVDLFTQKVSHGELLNSEEKVALFQFFHGETNRLPSQFERRKRKQYSVNPRYDDYNLRSQSVTNEPYPAIVSPQGSFQKLQNFTDDTKGNMTKTRVVRFRNSSGHWRTNGPDAISFRCSKTIVLNGVQIFGPDNEKDQYNITLSVFDDTRTEIRHEQINLVTNTAKIYQLNLAQPVKLPAARLFTVVVQMKGTSTIRGCEGVESVTVGGVQFNFMNSNKSSNGTDVNEGQIPAILFSVAVDS